MNWFSRTFTPQKGVCFYWGMCFYWDIYGIYLTICLSICLSVCLSISISIFIFAINVCSLELFHEDGYIHVGVMSFITSRKEQWSAVLFHGNWLKATHSLQPANSILLLKNHKTSSQKERKRNGSCLTQRLALDMFTLLVNLLVNPLGVNEKTIVSPPHTQRVFTMMPCIYMGCVACWGVV